MWSMDKPTIELLLVKARGVVETQIGPSEDDLRRQDEIWKKEILNKRRKLGKEVETSGEALAKTPEDAGLKKKLRTSLSNLSETSPRILKRIGSVRLTGCPD